jgi:lysozyme
MPPHREAAILSFTFNLGPGPICTGAVGRYLNAGDVTRACDAMRAYVYASGKRIAGLVRRREIERELCLRND